MTLDWQPHLTGDLLALRPAAPDDFEPLFAVASDPLIWALHPAHDRWRRDVFRRYFDQKIANGGMLIATDRASGQTIGTSRFSTDGTRDGEIEIGSTFLARSHWGGRFNQEMKRLMLDHAFRFAERAIFLIGEHNIHSRRAIEKIGGRLTDRLFPAEIDGRAVVHVVYAIDRPL